MERRRQSPGESGQATIRVEQFVADIFQEIVDGAAEERIAKIVNVSLPVLRQFSKEHFPQLTYILKNLIKQGVIDLSKLPEPKDVNLFISEHDFAWAKFGGDKDSEICQDFGMNQSELKEIRQKVYRKTSLSSDLQLVALMAKIHLERTKGGNV